MTIDPAHHIYNIQLAEYAFQWFLFISKFSSAAPNLAFPLNCCTRANNLYQTSKRTLVKNSKTTQQRISCLLEDIDFLTTFEGNHFLQLLLQNIEAETMVCSGGQARGSPYRKSTSMKKTKPYSDAEDDLDDDYQDVSVDDSFYNDDPAVSTPVSCSYGTQPTNECSNSC